MKRKLRKSLSWLLTVAMIFSLFCGMIPTASALPIENTTITGDGGVISTTYYQDTISGQTTLTIVVKNSAGEEIDRMVATQTYQTATTMIITLNEAYHGVYELDDITIDDGEIRDWSGNFDSGFQKEFTCDPGSQNATITVTLKEPTHTIVLNDRNDQQFGAIVYKEGVNSVTVNTYLNYELVGTDTIQMANTVNNFRLSLHDGYYFDTDQMQQVKCISDIPGQTFTYNRGTDGKTYDNLVIGLPAAPPLVTSHRGTVELYFFTYEDGVKVDFTRYVDGGALNLDNACETQTISFEKDGQEYSFEYADWSQTGVVFLPEDTTIYVAPNIEQGYAFDYWKTADAYGDHANSLYTVVNGQLKEESGIEGSDEGVFAFSEDMAFKCSTGYDRLQIGLYMVTGSQQYTITYYANAGTDFVTGNTDPQTFKTYGRYIRENGYEREGYTFDGWNTAANGSGENYTPGTFYSDKHNLTLYAQWKDSGTTPPDPSDEYDITGFTKELVTSEEATPEGITGIQYPENGVVIVPESGSVTLLYKLTVTGDVGAAYTITDPNVTVVSGELSGTLETATEEIYVTKTFSATDIQSGVLTNSATIDAGADTEVTDENIDDDTATVPAEIKPDGPTEDELKDAFAGKIQVECANAHATISYDLDDVQSGYDTAASAVEKTDGNWVYNVQINTNPFLTAYNTDSGEERHELVDTTETQIEATLIWNAETETWSLSTPDPVVINVICINPDVDAIQVVMSDGVQALYDTLGIPPIHTGRWTHVDTQKAPLDYIPMGDDGWENGELIFGTTANDITGVTLGDSDDKADQFWFPMDHDNGIYAKLEVSYGYTYNPADFLEVGPEYYTLILYCQLVDERPEEPGTPEPPTGDEITDPNGILADAVKLYCSTADHGEAFYDIAPNTENNDSYIIGEVTGDAATGYTCTITVNAVESYLTQYNGSHSSTSGHSYVDGTQSDTIDLIWNGNEWKVKDGETPVTFNVTCDNGTVTPPTEDEVIQLLNGKKVIGVDCITDGTYGVHTDKSYALIAGSFKVGTAQQGADGTWTCPVVVSYGKYLEQYNSEFPGHEFVDKYETKSFTLTYNESAWTYTGTIPAFSFDVACEAPEKPTKEEIEGAFTGDDTIVKVECITTGVNHPDQYFKKLLEGSWTAGDVKLNSQNQWTSVITVTAEQYVGAYQVKEPEHKPVGTKTKTFTLVLDGEAWTYSGDSPAIVFDSACTVPEKPSDDEITGIFSSKDAVHVICESNKHESAVFKELWANEDGKTRYSVSDPELVDGDWTCTVTILPTVYVDQYNTNTGADHWLDPAGQTGEKVTLTWDGTNWTAVDNHENAWATFTVACVPEKPGDGEIPGIVDPDPGDDEVNAQIQVKCVYDKNTHALDTKNYDLWANTEDVTRYTVGEPAQDKSTGVWTCTVTFKGETYVTRYNEEEELNGVSHGLVPGQADQTVVLTWNAETQKWTAPTALTNPIATFQVTCDPTVVGSFELTYNANGGKFYPNGDTSGQDTYSVKKAAGTYTLAEELPEEVIGPMYSQPVDKGKVLFAGWTTEKPESDDVGRIYQAGDTDVPATITSVEIVNGDVTVFAVWGYDEDEDGVADINEIVITPADITIYTGGSNYKGDIVDENGDELTGSDSYNGFPEPGFYITLPTALNNQLQGDATGPVNLSDVLSFVYEAEGQPGKTWALQMYNPESPSNIAFSKYVYRMIPAEGQEPVRLQIEGDDGPISDDKLEDFDTNNLFETYTMSIYGGDVKTDAVKAQLTISGVIQSCDIYVDSGVLTVRGTTESAETVAINDSANNANGFQVTAENGNKYYINGSDIEVDAQNVHLLTDELTGGQTQLQGKAEIALNNAGIKETDGLTYDFMYLDLVDNSNGNAYVTLNQNNEDDTVTIHWPMPTNADPETIRVVHFDGLDRNYTDVDESIETCKTSVLETGRDKDGNITFTTYTFSPFALVYETKDPGTGPDTDPDDDKDDDDHYTGGGGNDNDSEPTGNLSIELDVNGGDDEFTFTVYFTDEDGDDLRNNFYYNGDYTGTIGSGDEITLEGGDKIVIRNLPEGTRYEVIIETADGYTYVIDGEEGIIRTSTNEAEFTATRTVPLADPSVTGVSRWLNVTDHIAYLTGYPGGAFGPDNSMTRAEVAQMFYALLNNKNVTITKTFPDVPADAWYATAVNTLASLGMVSGDANGNYRPNDPITRAEFCVIALAFAYEPDNAVCYFSDVSRSDWFYTYVAQAASYGWIGGYTNGNFGPNDRITRAQVTTIVNNMLGRAADRDYVIDHQADLVQFTDLNRTYWGYYQIMEATNAHDYTKSNGTENWR